MAKYTSQYTFGVSADTKNAQGSLSSLTKSLRSLQSAKYTLQINDQSVKKAAESAATLQTALRNAVNVDTGKLNLSKFNSELQSAGTSLQKLSQTLISSGQQGQQAFTQLANSIAQAEMPVRSLNKVFAQMGTTLMNTIKWQAASSLIHGLMSNISGAISYAKNLNSTLNDIQIVTGASSDQMARFAEQANKAAKSLSTSTNEFAKASLIYYQQGDNAALAAKKAEITTKAANIAFTASAQEMSQMLTAVWNSFQMGEDQLEHAVDVMAKLGASTASSMEEMAKAMQKVAATANTVGVSMDQMSAIVATAASVTRQAPETIGTAWNTVLGRISNLKLGETLEDGVDLTKYTKALQSIGVNVLDATGELRDMGTVIEEIGAKWQTLDKAQKSALAATIGGVRQYTQINAFFENFDKYQKNLKDYTGANATGELNKQQEIYAQSWEAASKRVKASMETVYSQLIDDKAITKLTSFLADLINFGTNLTSTFGGLGNVISLVVTQIAQANIEKLSTKIQEAGSSIKQLFTGDSGQINQYKQSIQDTITMLEAVSNNNNTSSSMSTEIQFDVEILKMKEQLIEKEGKLTEAQKQTANQIIENMQANKSYYVEMMKGQEEAKKAIENTKQVMTEQMKERIAESTDPNLYAENKRTSYAQHQQDLRVANHMVMDVMPEDVRNRVYDVLQAMGQIKDKTDDITVGKLVHSLQQAAEEAGRYTAIMNRAQEAFGDAKGNWTAQQYQGSDQDRFDMIQSMAQQAANSKDQGASDTGNQVLANLTNIDPSNVTALNEQLALLKEALGQAETSAGTAMDTLKSGAEAAGQNVDDLVQKSLEVGGNLETMADDAKESMNKFKEAFKKSLDTSSNKIQKFAQGAIAVQRVATAFSAVGNAIKKLSDPNVGIWEKFTTVLSTLVTVGFAVSSVMTYIKTNQTGMIGSMLAAANAAIVDAAAQGTHATAYGVLAAAVTAAKEAIKRFQESNVVGWILTLIGIVIALTVAIASLVSGSNKKWAEKLENASKDLTESMEETSSQANKLQTDLSNLQDIMHDTSLTYEEQLTRINEICAAYGVQATMLDILSGNYTKLASAMTIAAQAKIGELSATADMNAARAQDIADERVQQSQADNFWSGAGKVLLGSAVLGAVLGPVGAVLGTVLAGTEIFGKKTVTNSFNRSHDVKDQGEAEAIAGLTEQLDSLGFKINTWGEIAEKSAGTGDNAGLLKLLKENESLTKYTSDQSSYTAQLIGQLSGYGYDTVLTAQQQQRDLSLQRELLNNPDIDLFGMRTTKADVREVAQIIKETTAATEQERAKLADYLSTFDNYQEAAAEYAALNEFAAGAAQRQIDLGITVGNKDEIAQQIMDDLLEDDTIEVEAIVKIDPTDVIFDEESGKYKVDEAARKFAEDQLKHERAIQRQALLDENKDIMTADTIGRADYTTLWQSGLFETEEQLQEFVSQSAETRARLWDTMYNEAVDAELSAFEASVADAEERLPELTERVNNWYDQLLAKRDELIAKGIIDADETLGMTGEQLYQHMINKRAEASGIVTAKQGVLDEYTAAKEGDDDARSKFARKYLGQDNWDANKAEQYAQQVQTELNANETLVTNLNAQLAEGERLMTNLAAAQQVVTDNTANAGRDAYGKWTTAVEEATEASEAFSESIDNQGSITADTLAKLAKYDSEVYNKYTQMTATDWNTYAYQKTMEYYDQLAVLYQNDAAKLIEIQQKKREATQNYYEKVKTLAKEAADAEIDAIEEQVEKITTAYDNLSKPDLSTFSGIQKLKQSLIEVGYAAEEADRLIKNIGKEKDVEKTAEELWAVANAQIALLLDKQSKNDEKAEAAKYIVDEEHTNFIYLKDDEAGLVDLQNGSGTYEIKQKTDGLYLVKPGTNELVPLTKASNADSDAGYTIYFDKSGAYYYVDDAGKLHDLTAASVNKQGYTIYANPTGTGFIYIDPTTRQVKNLVAAKESKSGYTIFANPSGTGFVYLTPGSTKLKNLRSAGVTSSGYTIYADPDPNSSGFVYLDGEGKLQALTAAGATTNGYTIYATKDTEKDGWVYITTTGNVVSLKPVGTTSAGYKVTADASGALWIFEPDGNGGYKLKQLTSEDPDAQQIIEKLKVDNPNNDFTLVGNVWTLNLDTSDVTKHMKVIVSYDDIKEAVAANNAKWTNVSDKKHTYLEGTGFHGLDGGIGSLNAIGDFLGYEGRYGAHDTHWLEDVMQNWQGDVVGWLQANDKIESSNTRARVAYTAGAQALADEIIGVDSAISDGSSFGSMIGYSNKLDRTDRTIEMDSYMTSMDDIFAKIFKDFGIEMDANIGDWVQMAKEYMVTDTQSLFDWYTENVKPTTSQYGDYQVYRFTEPGMLTHREGSSDKFEGLIPITAEELYDSDAMKTMLGMISSWIAADLDLNSLFKDATQKFDFMKVLSKMFSVKDGKLAEGYDEIAYYCMQGFIKGLTGQEPIVQELLTQFGVDSLETLRAVFGIASPSKYTREMGKYLVEGLEEGLNETEVDFGAFGKRVLQGIKDSILAANNGEPITMEDMWDLMVPQDQTNPTQITTHDKVEYLKTRNVDIIEVQNGDSVGYQVVDALDHSRVLMNDIYESADAAADAAGEAIYAEDEVIKYINGGYWSDASLTNMQKAIYETLIDKTLKKLGKGNTFEEYLQNGGTVTEFMAEWSKQYSAYLGDFENESEATWANILDIIENVIDTQDKKDQAVAKNMLTRWQNIYKGIAAARKAAFSDEDATYGGSMSKEQRDAILTEKFSGKEKFTGQDALTWLTSKVDVNSADMQYRSYSSKDLRSLGTAYTGFSHAESGAPIITNAFDYYTHLRTSEINRNRDVLLAHNNVLGTSEAEGISVALEALLNSTEPIKTEDLVAIIQAKFPNMSETDAKSLAMSAFGIKDQIDADETGGLRHKFVDLADDENLTEATADYLATTIVDKDSAWDSGIAAELLQYVNGTLTEPLSERAQQIVDQYAGDAVAAIEDFYQYLMDTAADIKAEYDARTEQRKSETDIAKKVAGGEYLVAAEQREWDAIQKKYGSQNATEAIIDIAQAQGADEAMTNWQTNQLNQGITVTQGENGSYDVTNLISGEQQHYESLAQLQAAYGLLTEESTYLEEAEAALASALGVTDEAFAEERDSLLAASGDTRSYNQLTSQEKTELLELTATVLRINNAWDALIDNGKNWISTLSKTKKGTKDYDTALKSLTKNTKTFFGNSTKVSEAFVESHTKDIEKMLEGDEDALERLQDDIIDLELSDATASIKVDVKGADNVRDAIDNFEDMFKDLEDGAVVTPTMDTSGATQALIDLMNQGGETAEQIEAALAAVGWEPQIEMEEVPLESVDQGDGTAQVPKIQFVEGIPTFAGYESVPITAEMREAGSIQIPKLNSKGQGKITGLKKTGAGQSSGKNTSSGGGGGGGGSAKKVESYKKGSDEKDRYHEITAKLTEQSNLLTRLDKLKSRTFGAAHVKAINDEIAALDKEAKLYGDLAKEASTELEANKKILTSYGATFNKDGTINYEEYMDKILAQYNKAVDKYNNSSQSAGDELALKKAEEIYNEAKKAMEDYEEDMAKLNEAQENMLEYQNKISAAMLEGIQYKVEVQFDLNDRDVKQLQYLRNSWEDFLDKQDDSFTKMTEEALIYEDNLKILGASFDELNAAYADGTLNQADYASGMQDLNDKMLEQLENLLTIKKSIKEAYGNTLEMANQELEKYNSILEHSRNVMQSYIQMQQLMGLGADYSGLKEMYQMSLDASNASVAAAKQHLDVLKKSRADIEAQVEKYGWTDVLKQQWEDVNNAIIEGEDDLLSKTQQALEDAQAVFTNTMQSIIQDFDQTLFGMKNGLANLEDDYSYYQEEQARYLSTSKELYEVAKLNRQIDQSIADTTTKTSKERLKALQEQIKAQAESTRLTEYDVQMMELQYKHALALQELEDAKNAKSVVRLTRDENGNFGYQYTADDKGISDAQQKVDDALQQINELAANRVAEMEQAAVNAERQYRDSLLEIAQDTTLTLEERQAKMEELTRRHAETMQFNQEQYNNAQTALLTNQQYVYERYGVSIMTNTGLMQDQYNENIAKMMAKTEDYAQYLKAQMEPKGAIYEAMQKYKEDMELVTTTSGLGGWAGMTASVDEYRQANQEAQAAIAGIEKTLKETLANIDASTEKWNQHGAVLEAITARYEALAEAAADAVKDAAGNVAGTTVGGASTGAAQEHAQDEGTGQKHWRYIWGYEHFAGTEAGYDSKRAAEKGAIQDMKQKIYAALEAGETDAETAANKAKLDAIYEKALGTIITTAYKTGGLIDFTGPAWVDGSREQPELMLNSTDTRNLLRTVDLVREIDMETLAALYDSINQSALGMMYAMSGITAPSGGQSGELKQNVTITADFPNATDRNEISAAFEDLVNLAAQYANR